MKKLFVRRRLLSVILSFVLFLGSLSSHASTQAEYCEQLATITQNNEITGGAAEGALLGYQTANCQSIGYTAVYAMDRIVVRFIFQ